MMPLPAAPGDGTRATAEPRVACLVLNSNRRADTLECLASLHASSYPNLQIVLLDCASSDGSVEAVRTRFPAVRIVALEENRGYAGNNNVGIALALQIGADWVCVLNEDTVLAPDCLALLVRAGEGDPGAGIVGPMVYHHDEPRVIQSAGGGLTRLWRGYHHGQNEDDRGQFPAERPVQWVTGCAIMVRRQVIEAVGGLDDRFFIYWEETEWCLRAARAGWRIVHVPSAKVWHKGVQRVYRPAPSVTYYSTRNRFLMLSAHDAPLAAWLVAWLETARTLVTWSVRPRWRGMREHRNAMARGAADFLRGRSGRMPAPAAHRRQA